MVCVKHVVRKSQQCYFLTRYIKKWIVEVLQVPYSLIPTRDLKLFPTHQFWETSQHMEFLGMKSVVYRLPLSQKNESQLKTNTIYTYPDTLWRSPRVDSGANTFSLHFNELPSLLKSCKMIMYAEDTVLYYSHKDMKEIEKILS